jgi:hypothetical protein
VTVAQGEEVDVAINMYKKARMYDQMIRLVSQFRKDNLAQVWRGDTGGVTEGWVGVHG